MWISIKHVDGYTVTINLANITHFNRDAQHTIIYLVSGGSIAVDHPYDQFEKMVKEAVTAR